jgi:hypothetical protein
MRGIWWANGRFAKIKLKRGGGTFDPDLVGCSVEVWKNFEKSLVLFSLEISLLAYVLQGSMKKSF